MAKPKDEQKLIRIHEAALKLVLKTGFAGLKMAAVAQEAGIATGTLYIYYGSREELINGLFAAAKSEIISVLHDPAHADPSLPKAFKNTWMAYFLYCFRNPEKMQFVEQFKYSGLVSQELMSQLEEGMKGLDTFLAEAIRLGFVRDMNLEILKAHMQGSIHDIVRYLHLQNQTPTTADLDLYFSLIWNGLRN